MGKDGFFNDLTIWNAEPVRQGRAELTINDD
jgi:hypothetical protein